PDDDVVIDLAGATVRYLTGATTVHTIVCHETLEVAGGSLTTSGAMSSSGTLSLTGGTLTGLGGLSVTGPTNFAAGVLGSPATLTGGQIQFGTNSTVAGSVVCYGNVTMTGTVPANFAITLETAWNRDDCTLTAADGAANAGTILLDWASGRSTHLQVAGGGTF